MGNRFPSAAKRVTIKDVASLAGVSKGTVSKYLADGEYYVAKETGTRIAAAIKELDFHVNALARGLVHRRTQTIGMIVASVTNPLYPELIMGVEDVLGRAGFTLLFGTTEGSAEREKAVLQSMQQRQVDGFILASVTVADAEVGELVNAGVNVILASRHLRSDNLVDGVIIDNAEGARLAVEHLVAHGHKLIGHIAGPQDIYPFEVRRATYQAVLAQGKQQTDSLVAVAASTAQEDGALALAELLDSPTPPTAVFVASDNLALGALELCAERGIRVPEDLAIVGFDNIRVGGLRGVQLTTVDSRARDIGRIAAERLVDRIDERWKDTTPQPARLEVLQARLIRRGTCGCQPDKPGGSTTTS